MYLWMFIGIHVVEKSEFEPPVGLNTYPKAKGIRPSVVRQSAPRGHSFICLYNKKHLKSSSRESLG